MRIEHIIYILEIILVMFLLFKFTPRDKVRMLHAAFLFKLVITWPVGLIVAEYRLIEYPVRVFTHATKASFLFEFFFYPALCAIFIVNYPQNKNAFTQFKYYFYWCTALTVIEVLHERYTDILKYIHWNWGITWITFLLTFYAAKKYNDWFFKDVSVKSK